MGGIDHSFNRIWAIWAISQSYQTQAKLSQTCSLHEHMALNYAHTALELTEEMNIITDGKWNSWEVELYLLKENGMLENNPCQCIMQDDHFYVTEARYCHPINNLLHQTSELQNSVIIFMSLAKYIRTECLCACTLGSTCIICKLTSENNLLMVAMLAL